MNSNSLIIVGIMFIPAWSQNKKEILLPKTCYFINNSSLQEINAACQKGKKEDFFPCIEWTPPLSYDVCSDYYDLWMEEYHTGQTIGPEGYLE